MPSRSSPKARRRKATPSKPKGRGFRSPLRPNLGARSSRTVRAREGCLLTGEETGIRAAVRGFENSGTCLMISENPGATMGGYGSGRRGDARDTTADYLRMDVRFMERQGYLRVFCGGSLHWSRRGERFASINFRSESDRVVLSYKNRTRGEEWESLEYPVLLERTPCNYGGFRSWFRCPASGCGRRTATLFGGRIFACRRCYGLAYESQRQLPHDRAADRAQKILDRLRAEHYTIFDTAPPRLKGMHRRTYERLRYQYSRSRHQAVVGVATMVGIPVNGE